MLSNPEVAVTTLSDAPAELMRTGMRTIARVRDGRAFHPVGLEFSGTTKILGESPLPLISGEVTARLSKAAGTPGGWPDVAGLALRLPTTDGAIWDVVFSGPTVISERLPVPIPGLRWSFSTLSTLVPFRQGTGLYWLRARLIVPVDLFNMSLGMVHTHFTDGGTMRFGVDVATATTGFTPLAEVVLDHLDSDADRSGTIGFDPIDNVPQGISLLPPGLPMLRRIVGPRLIGR